MAKYYADETMTTEEILPEFNPSEDTLSYITGGFYEAQKKEPDFQTWFSTPRGTIININWMAFLCPICSVEVVIDRAIFSFFKRKYKGFHPACLMCQVCHAKLKEKIDNFNYKKWPEYLKTLELKNPDENWGFQGSKEKAPKEEDLEKNLLKMTSSMQGQDRNAEKKPSLDEGNQEIDPLEIMIKEGLQDGTQAKLEAFWTNMFNDGSSSNAQERKAREEQDMKNGLCRMCKQKIPSHKKTSSVFCSKGCQNKFSYLQNKLQKNGDIFEA